MKHFSCFATIPAIHLIQNILSLIQLNFIDTVLTHNKSCLKALYIVKYRPYNYEKTWEIKR